MISKPKISKQKPIWSPKLEKEFQQELKNSSKISVIKKRLKESIGKKVYLMLNNINKSRLLFTLNLYLLKSTLESTSLKFFRL